MNDSRTKKEIEIADPIKENMKITPGLIIAAYPGMGQEALQEVHCNYIVLDVYKYDVKNPLEIKKYVQEAIDLVTKPRISSFSSSRFDVCFVDADIRVIDELDTRNQPFLIYYPANDKETVIKRLAVMYNNNQSVRLGKSLADVVLNHETKITELRLYSNAIASKFGLINNNLLTELIAMPYESRTKIVSAIGELRTAKKQEPTA